MREESILAKKYNHEFHRKLETQQFCPTETGRQKKILTGNIVRLCCGELFISLFSLTPIMHRAPVHLRAILSLYEILF